MLFDWNMIKLKAHTKPKGMISSLFLCPSTLPGPQEATE